LNKLLSQLIAASTIIFSALASQAIAQEGLPPVNSGTGHLTFLERAQGGIILSKFVPEPLTGLAWHGTEIIGTVDVANQGLTPPSPQIEVRYSLSNPDFAAQHEVMLFARDPEETFLVLQQMINDNNAWNKDVSPENLPTALTAVYPPNPSFVSQHETHVFPSVTDFWPPPIAPSGPGTRPEGLASIKAARVINHGLCSSELPVLQILDQVSDAVWDKFQEAIQDASNCITQIRDFSQATSFLHQTTDLEPAQFGGFFLNFAFRTIDKHPTIKNDNVRFNVDYWFRLRDGRLSAESTYNLSDVNGGSADAIAAGLFPGLLNDVGSSIYQQADTLQQYHGVDISKDQNSNLFPCTLQGAGRDDPTLPADGSPGVCQKLIDQITDDALLGGATLTPPLNSNERAAVTETIKRSVIVNGKPNFENLRCAKFESDPGQGRCEYIIRAKRLNALPDAVELVFLDGNRELANPAYPIWLLLEHFRTQGLIRDNSALCSRQPVSSPTGHRSFISSPRGYAKTEANFSRLQCLL
jgi:hypothetical protein